MRNSFYWLAFLLLLLGESLILVFNFKLPIEFSVLAVQSGSMAPVIKPGSLVIVRPAFNYQKGEIITFQDSRNPQYLVTHRIFEIKGENFITKGDANNVADKNEVAKERILGKVVLAIPFLGYPVSFAKTQTGLIVLVIIPAVVIVYSEVLNVQKEIKKLWLGRKKKSQNLKQRIINISIKLLIALFVFSFLFIKETNSYFFDLEITGENSFSAGWWTDDEPPESSIIGLGPDQTSHNFFIDYHAEDFPSSGVKEVALYYAYTFVPDSWFYFATDVPDEFGEGSFEFNSPFGDSIYYFKTIATDNAGNTEVKDLAEAIVQVDTQKPITALSLGEFGENRFAVQELLANGNFEDSSNPSRGWNAGGNGDHRVVDDPTVVKRGDNSFLIGFKNTDLAGLTNLPAKDFLYQDLDLSDHSSATLSFWYRLETEDILDYDWFHVLIKNPITNEAFSRVVHDGSTSFRGDVLDFDWKEVTQSISQFVGQMVRLYFEVENTGDTDNRTWVYLDDIRVTEGDNYFTADAPVSLESSDASGSGVLTTEYKVDEGGWEEYLGPFHLVVPEGEHQLTYRSEDFNGLIEDEKTIDLVASPSAQFFGIVLNQISARPAGSDTGNSGLPLDGEWVELWNNSGDPIDVNGWVLYESDEGKLPISISNADNDGDLSDAGETVVPDGGWLKVYRNGDGDFTLNDDGDKVELYTNYKTSGGVLIDSFAYGAVVSDDKTWRRIPDGTGTWADPVFLEEVSFFFSEDKKAVGFSVKNISQDEKLSYEITYNADQGGQGIKGEIEINGQETISREDLKLGTCSAEGKVCTDHTGIKEINLKIVLIKPNGEDKIIEKKLTR